MCCKDTALGNKAEDEKNGGITVLNQTSQQSCCEVEL